MKKIFSSLLLLSLCALAVAQPDHKKMAQQVLNDLNERHYNKVTPLFDSIVSSKMDSLQLKQVYEGLLMQVGAFKQCTSVSTTTMGAQEFVDQLCEYEKTALIFRLGFNKKNQLSAIFFLPPPPKEPYREPSYAKREAITERDVVIKTGEYSLPGILTLPKEGKNFPLVILVHGSGPNDKDETIGPNKPFKDLALGLASNGIAVLRYDKRTFIYGAKMAEQVKELTVKEETMEDAWSALQLAKTFPEIDSTKIFLLGHSLGGMLVPRMAEGRNDLAGVIMMAGPARPLEDLVLEQTTYLLGLDGFTPEDKDALSKVKMQYMMVKKSSLSDTTSASLLPLNVPGKYWLDLKNYHQVETAGKLKLPMLILQGERDYQVTMEDFKLWQNALYSKKNVTLHSYPKLNHLFQEGEGAKSTPQEYEHQINVPEYVIKDIVSFVKKK